MAKKRYEYDVALSYAGENERFVRQVYRHLIAADVNVFFAARRAGHLWGKDESEFQRVFGPASRFVVPFISEHYATKEWPQLEFRAARKEARTRTGEFLLPVRLDRTKMRGLPSKLQYVDGRRFTPKAIATMLIEEKLGSPLPASGAAARSRDHAAVQLLPQQDAELLALIATAIFPLGAAEMQRLIPDVHWTAAAKRWQRQGWLKRARGHLEIAPEIRRKLFATRGPERRAHERWAELLFPLRGHSDVALALGLHYLSLRRVAEMLNVLLPIAEALEPGFWNDLYLNLFEQLGKTPHIRGAAANARVLFHNSYALLLTRNERHADALAQFAKLRTLSKRTNNAWGEGQSYINAGVAAAQAGDEGAAAAWYEKAIKHGRRHRDYWLLGRSLGNLAHFVDAATAAKLLDESERVKTRVGDAGGLAGTLMARGNLAAGAGDFSTAAASTATLPLSDASWICGISAPWPCEILDAPKSIADVRRKPSRSTGERKQLPKKKASRINCRTSSQERRSRRQKRVSTAERRSYSKVWSPSTSAEAMRGAQSSLSGMSERCRSCRSADRMHTTRS